MRLKTSIFVSAVLRKETSEGAFAALLKKGAEDAGAIFLVHQKNRNSADIFGPAPQIFLTEEATADRWVERLGEGLESEAVEKLLESQRRFDPDCWIVEIEKPGLLTSINIVKTE